MESPTTEPSIPTLQTLPGDGVRQILWGIAERYDLAMLVQSTRGVARGPVARMVAEGVRNTHEWTEAKNALLAVYDESGITAAGLDTELGGFIEGPKNLAFGLMAFELAWVDAGAATSSLASNLGLAPIHERGTPEQRAHYLGMAAPKQPGEDRRQIRAAFALTEPIPFVGVETGMLCGKAEIAEWKEGQEPLLHIDKRARFITGMAFADVVTAAVESTDPRIKGSFMVILEEGDPGVFDRGVPTKKLVHQLSSTRDPVFNLTVPASRIVGGYTVKDGVIIPRYTHSEVIESVFKRTRVPVGLMTSAKLLSAVEPVIRYQRNRFRGGDGVRPGSPRYDSGLQQKEDSLHRLVDVWAAGEAGASLGFATSRLYDEVDVLEKTKDRILEEKGLSGRAAFKLLVQSQHQAVNLLAAEAAGDSEKAAALRADPLVEFALIDAQANVLCPACKLWNTGHGATVMREAVSLMGGYGITEDCPAFLGQKWADAQLEATYEGPEAVQRLQLSLTMNNPLFLAQFEHWTAEVEHIAAERPGIGADTLARAMRLWRWTLHFLENTKDAQGAKLYHKSRQGVTFPLADALCWLIATRQQLLDILQLESKGAADPSLAEGLPGTVAFLLDLCHVHAASAAGEAGRICAELVYGYGVKSDFTEFALLRTQVDISLAGSRLAKDRAAESLARVMIPEALDYPL
ncbi:MAG: acyl-CoA/acyl-ACP dehydrogenase [Chthoniobacteraceae bacterium]|nr:acyl-CoA/acyl-ACP dehydrogenase [Chthoniobacteraceae bacterium]